MRILPTIHAACALTLAGLTSCNLGFELDPVECAPGTCSAPDDTDDSDDSDGPAPDVADDTASDDTTIDDTTASDATDVALPADWWDAAWGHRVALTVHTGAAAVGDDHSVRLTIDHAAWVAQGISRPDGADLRLVFRDDAGNLTELDRVLEPESGFDRPQTTLWFRLAAPLAADTTDATHYCLYLDHPDPGDAPDDWQAVFLAGDGFDDGQLGSSLSVSAHNSQVVEQGGRLTMTSNGQVEDAAIVVGTDPLPADRRFVVRHCGQVTTVGGDMLAESKLLGVVEWPSMPMVIDDNITENERRRVMLFHRIDGLLRPFYLDVETSAGIAWSATEMTWREGGPDIGHALGADLTVELHSDGERWWMLGREPLDAGAAAVFETTAVAWSDVASVGDPLWFYVGEPYGAFYWADQSSDYLLVRRHADPEPSVSIGALE